MRGGVLGVGQLLLTLGQRLAAAALPIEQLRPVECEAREVGEPLQQFELTAAKERRRLGRGDRQPTRPRAGSR